MNTTPPISCMCLTYGRPRVLEEAIESFLRQDYKGEKELLVLNDLADQTLIFNHPQVHIVNIKRRFKTVGEKRNAAAALCYYDWLAVWDDDDIYLPHRLSYSMNMMEETKRYFKPSKALVLNDGKLSGPKSNLYYSSGIWHRSLFDQVRGHAHMGSGQDMEIETKFQEIVPKKNYDAIKPEEIYYLYRWSGTGSFHLSGFGRDTEKKKKPGNEQVADYIADQKKKGLVETGDIILNPNWKVDYLQLVKEYLTLQSQSST